MTTKKRSTRKAAPRKVEAANKSRKPASRLKAVKPAEAYVAEQVESASEPDAVKHGTVHSSMADKIFAGIATFCTRHPWLIVIAFVVMAGLGAGLAVTKLKVDTDPGLMISNELEFRQQYKALAKTFPTAEMNFLFIVDGEEPAQARKAAERIEKALLARPDLFHHVVAPGVGKFFDDYGVLYADQASVKKLTDEIKQSAPAFNGLAQNPNLAGLSGILNEMTAYSQAGRAPEGGEVLLDAISGSVEAAADGKSVPLDWSGLGGAENGPEITETRWYVMSQPVLDFSEIEAAARPMAEARRLLKDPEMTGDGAVTIQLTGEAALNAEEFEAVTKGAVYAGVISFTLVTLTVFFGLPAMILVVPALGLVVLGFLINAGFATLSVGYLNMISVAFAVLFIGLGVDYAVHVILRYSEHRARGETAAEASVSAIRKLGPALALCTLTTALSFLAFVPTDFVGMAQLGIIASGGLVIAFVASMTLVPAILTLLPGKQEKYESNLAHLPAVNGNGHGGRSWTRTIATVVILTAAFGSLFAFPHARFDGDPINLKDPEAPTVTAFLEVLHDQPGEVYSGQVLVDPGKPAREMVRKLLALPAVRKVHTIEDFLPEDQAPKLAELNSLQEVVPRVVASSTDVGEIVRSRMLDSMEANMKTLMGVADAPVELQASATRLNKAIAFFKEKRSGNDEALRKLEESLFVKLPDMLADINTLASISAVSVNSLQETLRERFIADDGRWRLEVVPAYDMRNPGALHEFVKELHTVDPTASGSPVDIAGSADAVARSMIMATLAALVMVVLVSWPVLRRVTDVVLVLAPLVLAASLMVGYTVVFNAPFNFANVIVLPLLLGLGVDSSIHYVMRAREEDVATDVTGTSTPRAVMLSALTTIGSFGTLWLSGHLGMSSMGELLTIAILVTLMCTLVVLPQLMHWVVTHIDNKENPPGSG